MPRIAYDCTGVEAAWVRHNLPLPDVMLYYGTGSPSIEWTPQQIALFPANIMCEIDQGGSGSPLAHPTVRDVENGAWTVQAAINKAGWTAERKTLYGSRNTFTQCADAGWQGDFLLAWPGWAGEPLPSHPGINIIGVQDDWHPEYDKTTLLDRTWPGPATTPPVPGALSVTAVARTVHAAWPAFPGADHYDVMYVQSPGSTPVNVGNVPQPQGQVVVHDLHITVGGATGGAVSVYASVSGKSTLLGTRHLP